MSWVFRLWDSTIGKKAVMALTGVVLFGFVLIHMAGNLQIFAPATKSIVDGQEKVTYKIDDYGHMLKANPFVLWGARLFLLACVGLHILTSIQLFQRNHAAKGTYGEKNWRAASLPSRLMYLSGPMIFLFIVYHILHFTTGQAHTDFKDGLVHHNFVHAFTREWWAVVVYVAANILLGLHLSHGAWSIFQSLGINHPRWTPIIKIGARGVAALITLGNVLMPILVAAGLGR